MLPDHSTPRDGRAWPGGFYLANIHDAIHVRPAFGAVFLSSSHSLTGNRVSVELTPAEALAVAADLTAAARLALCAETLAPGDQWSTAMPGLAARVPVPEPSP